MAVRHGRCTSICTAVWGHMAGSPGLNPKDNSFLDKAIGELLAS